MIWERPKQSKLQEIFLINRIFKKCIKSPNLKQKIFDYSFLSRKRRIFSFLKTNLRRSVPIHILNIYIYETSTFLILEYFLRISRIWIGAKISIESLQEREEAPPPPPPLPPAKSWLFEFKMISKQKGGGREGGLARQFLKIYDDISYKLKDSKRRLLSHKKEKDFPFYIFRYTWVEYIYVCMEKTKGV